MLPICTKTKAMTFIGISVIYHLSFGVCFVCCFLIQLNTIWFDGFGCTNLQLKRHIMRFNRMKLNVRHIRSIYILAMEIILASIFSNEYVKLTHALFNPQIKSTPMLYTKKKEINSRWRMYEKRKLHDFFFCFYSRAWIQIKCFNLFIFQNGMRQSSIIIPYGWLEVLFYFMNFHIIFFLNELICTKFLLN